MRRLAFAVRSRFRPLLAILAFLIYAAGVLWHHNLQKSAWQTEQSGALLFAASYLYYGKPFGAIDRGLWDFFIEHASSARDSDQVPGDSFLARAAGREIPSGNIMPTTLDGNGLGYAYFATGSLFLFGPHTNSLVFGFLIFLGVSLTAFLLRFSDDRLLSIPILFVALTVMLLTPHATSQWWVDQSPIGGIRFFIIAGILPTLHIVFELLDSNNKRARTTIYGLLTLQLAVLLAVTTIRMSSTYFLGAIVFAAILSIFLRRRDPKGRRLAMTKVAVLLIVSVIAQMGGRWLIPNSYTDVGLASETFWHRTFSALGAHPDWPFGNLAVTIDCRPDRLRPGVLDRNGHCAYTAAIKNGAGLGPLYGAQYEKVLRQEFLKVAEEYPRKVLETYVIYKPLLIWNTLSSSMKFDTSPRSIPILIAVAFQILILLGMIRLPPGETGQLPNIFLAFSIIVPFSLVPPVVAYSGIGSSTDLICYMYVGLVLVASLALRALSSRHIAATAHVKST